MAVALDTATKDRLGERTNAAFSAAPLLINVDHHGTNPRYGHLNHIDTTSPATGQIVYELLTQEGFPMDDVVRQNLFAAISTDTGSFQFSSTTPRTHRIIAEMMEAGLDNATLSQKLYHEHPRRRMHLLKALLNEMKFSARRPVASWALTVATQQAAQMEPGDTEGLDRHAALDRGHHGRGDLRGDGRGQGPRQRPQQGCAARCLARCALSSAAADTRWPRARACPVRSAAAESRFLEALKNEIERIR